MTELTAKQQKFVDEYLVDLNATQAAIRSGYSEKTARSIGQENLTKPDIASAIQEAQKHLQTKTGITVERVLEEYAKLGFANMLDYIETTAEGEFTVDLSELTRDQAAAIGEVTAEVFMDGKGEDTKPVRRTKFKLADKKSALDSIARHLGMFNDKSEVTHKGLTFIVNK